MEINSLIGLIVVPVVFISIPLIWKLTEKYDNNDQWTNWENGVMSIDGYDIYLANALNRKAKKFGIVTSETCDSMIHFNNDSIIYRVNDELQYDIPLTSIDSVVDAVDYYDIIKNDEEYLYHEIIIKLKVGSCIKMIVNDEEMVMKSERGYNNIVEVDDLNLVDFEHKLLLNKLVMWKEKLK